MGKKGKRIIVAATLVGVLSIMTGVYGATRGAARGGIPESFGQQKAAAPASVSSCPTKKGLEADNATPTGTTSTTFVDVPGMTVTFNAKAAGCALVSFTAYSFASGGELMNVHAVSNGAECLPGEYQFSGDDDEDADGQWARSHGANFTCKVALGANTIKMQFRSFFGGSVTLHKKAMLVWRGA
jgi:hypothetical protein